MINHNSSVSLSELLKIPAFWITLVLIIGFVFSPGAADVLSIKAESGGISTGGKLVRVVSVFFAGAFAFFSLYRRNSFADILKGNLGIIFLFACLAYFSVVFSQLKTMTIYKSSELIVMLFIAATLYGRSKPYEESKKYITGLFWIYAITAVGALLQLAYYGTGEFKQVYSAPFLNFVLSSHHPPLAANALGLLGALVSLFGMYQFYKCTSNKTRCYTVGGLIASLGLAVLILSYTRSALALFMLTALMFLYFGRKYTLLAFSVFIVVVLLSIGGTRDLVESHMRRGDSDQNLATLSSRSVFWENFLQRSPISLSVGHGYATGTIFIDYEENRGEIFWARNAHNSVIEIINSTGIVGALIWLVLIIRINIQLMRHLLRSRHLVEKDEYLFHLFVTCVFILASLRSIMNSTFVYLDYFLPLLFVTAVYADTLLPRRAQINQQNEELETGLPVDTDETPAGTNMNAKPAILSYKKTGTDKRQMRG